MHALGLCVIAGALWFWLRLQGTPRYVALKGANALFGGGSPDSLPLHEGELAELGVSKEHACDILEKIQHNYLPGAKIVSEPEFRAQPGKDVLAFQVEVRPGQVARTAVEVIDEDGRGVVMFGDLVASMRAALYYAAEAADEPGPYYDAINGISDLLVAEGVEGYWDMANNRLSNWPKYSVSGERM